MGLARDRPAFAKAIPHPRQTNPAPPGLSGICSVPGLGLGHGGQIVGLDRFQALAVAQRLSHGIAQPGVSLVIHGVSQSQFEWIDPHLCSRFIQCTFQGEGRLGSPKSAHLASFWGIGMHHLGLGVHSLPTIGAAACHQRVARDPEAIGIVGSRVCQNAQLEAGHCSIGSHADSIVHVVGVPLGRGVERLAAAVRQAYRSPDVVGSQRSCHQGPGVLLATESTSNGWRDNPHSILRQPQHARSPVPGPVRLLVTGDNGHASPFIYVAEYGLSLQR